MTKEERQTLIEEKNQLELKMKQSEFINPKDMRRVNAITSLLLSDGKTEDIRLVFKNGKESTRVTSFTKDRR